MTRQNAGWKFMRRHEAQQEIDMMLAGYDRENSDTNTK